MRDDFTKDVKRKLAARVGHRCSNPECRAPTAGPQDDPTGSINLGVAAHITAARVGGPRYKPLLTADERKDISNAIWLCQNCAKLIDSDVGRYNEGLLQAWKIVAEDYARNSVGRTIPASSVARLELFLEPEKVTNGPYSRAPVRYFVLGLRNVGAAIAKFPGIRYKQASGLKVDRFGIDGNCGFGLPQSPSETEWVRFHGGADDVIHVGDLLKITKLWQTGVNKGTDGLSVAKYPNLFGPLGPTHHNWLFQALTFEYEIAAEGISRISGEFNVAESFVEWPT